MENFEVYRDQFRIFALDEDFQRGHGVAQMLRKKSYNFATFNNKESLVEIIEKQMPHIFILYYQPLDMNFHNLISQIRQRSHEVEIILIAANDFWPGVRTLIKKGLVNDFWPWPLASQEVLPIRINQVIEKIIFKYIAEQKNPTTENLVEKIMEEKQMDWAPPTSAHIWNVPLEAQSEGAFMEELMGSLKENFSKSDFAYVKNYKARNQLLITRTSFCKETYYHGQALELDEKFLERDSKEGYRGLEELLKKIFRVSQMCLKPVGLSGDNYGFLVAINFDPSEDSYLQKVSRSVSLTLRNLQLESSQSSISSFSSPWQISSEDCLLEVSKELYRARCLKSPLSAIWVHWEFAEKGQSERFFRFISENIRIYDFFSQMDTHHGILILPHCAYEYATMKAEFLRRNFIHQSTEGQAPPVRLCLGVTEYPRLSANSDQILDHAKEACTQVLVSGQNKVCLHQAVSGYEPEWNLNL